MTTQYIYGLADTWNDGATTFTSIKMDVTDSASNASSLLMDLQVGTVSKFNVRKDGSVVLPASASGYGLWGSLPTSTGYYAASLGEQSIYSGGSKMIGIHSGSSFVVFNSRIGFSTTADYNSQDLVLTRGGAANLQLGDADTTGTTAPTAQFLSAQSWSSSTTNNQTGANFTIDGSQGTGTGAGGSIIFRVAPAGGTSNGVQNGLAAAWSISGAGHFLAGTDNIYDIGASGATRPRSVYTGASAYFGGDVFCANGIFFGGASYTKGYLYSNSDGVWSLNNSTSTSFGRLQFGGTTSSFPALKVVSANLQVIAADGTSSAGLIVGNQALATAATNGFLYVPTCAGTPTGTPTTQTGTVPIVVDTTNNKLYFYSNAAWRDAGP